MSLLKIGTVVISLLIGQSGHAENPSQSLMPIGVIPKNSKISLKPASSDTSYFDPAVRNEKGNEFFQQVSADSLYKVQTLQTQAASAELADLQALINRQQLMVQQAALNPTNSNCSSAGIMKNCMVLNNIPVFKAGPYNFMAQYSRLLGVSGTGSERQNLTEPHALVKAFDKKISDMNSEIAGNKSIFLNCEVKLPEGLMKSKTLTCGVQQARDAFKKAKAEGKLTEEVFIFNDFSLGSVMGKMWFLNSDGTLATNILGENPIPVSRGEGGFGKGKGSLKTPDGAIKTLPYNPPRDGNIKDGIECEGLEPGNSDIHGRGILLHGWDPNTATQGCLGIAGSYHSNSAGHRKYGGSPLYLDELKNGLLKNGGVMIYSFTPKKANLCKD